MMDPHHFLGLNWGEWVSVTTLLGLLATLLYSLLSKTARESTKNDFARINDVMLGVKTTMAELNATIRQLRDDMDERKKTEDRMHKAIDDHEKRLVRLETQEEEERR